MAYVQRNRHRRPARPVERFHDARLVRPHRIQIQARTLRHTGHRTAQLGHRPVRILLPGSGQPHRVVAIRRAVLDLGTESHPGGGLALGLHAVRTGFHEVGLPALEPPRRFPLPDTGGLLHLPEIAAPAAGRTAVPDRRCLPIKSIRILPGPSFPVRPALPAGHGGKSDTSSRSSARYYCYLLLYILISKCCGLI